MNSEVTTNAAGTNSNQDDHTQPEDAVTKEDEKPMAKGQNQKFSCVKYKSCVEEKVRRSGRATKTPCRISFYEYSYKKTKTVDSVTANNSTEKTVGNSITPSNIMSDNVCEELHTDNSFNKVEDNHNVKVASGQNQSLKSDCEIMRSKTKTESQSEATVCSAKIIQTVDSVTANNSTKKTVGNFITPSDIMSDKMCEKLHRGDSFNKVGDNHNVKVASDQNQSLKSGCEIMRSKTKREKQSKATVCSAEIIQTENSSDKDNNIPSKIRSTPKKKSYKMTDKSNQKITATEETKSFTCKYCKKIYLTESKLIAHENLHDDIKSYTCSYCDKIYWSENSFNLHEQKHTGDEPYECTTCGKTFVSDVVLHSHKEQHVEAHTDGKPYSRVCGYCGELYTSKCMFENHQRTHTGEKPFKCDICPKAFVSKSLLRKHNKCHDKKNACSYCDNRFSTKSALMNHERTHTGEKPYACDLCPEGFRTARMLVHHKKMHTGQKNYLCSYCSKCTWTKKDLIRHEKIHMREPSIYSCSLCSKRFINKAGLKGHARSHVEKKCFICSKIFATSTALSWHKTHKHNPLSNNTIPATKGIKCDVCKISFVTYSQLQKHQRKKHLSYMCSVCSQFFGSTKQLKEHEKTHVPKKHRCEICGRYFRQLEVLMKHVKSHPSPKPPDQVLNTDNSCQVYEIKVVTYNDRIEVVSYNNPTEAVKCDDPTEAVTYNDPPDALKYEDSTEAVINNDSTEVVIYKDPTKAVTCDDLTEAVTYSDPTNAVKYDDSTEAVTYDEPIIVIEVHDDLGTSDEHPPQASPDEFGDEITGGDRHESEVIISQKSHVCTYCNKAYKCDRRLRIHMRSHTGEQPFACGFCPMKFKQNRFLQLHQMEHSDQFKFSCDTCGKKYKRELNLQNHKRTHTGERPFVCEICDQKFMSRKDLVGHKKTHLPKEHSCLICGRAFRQQKSLEKHVNTHSLQQKIEAGAVVKDDKAYSELLSKVDTVEKQTGDN